LVRKLRKTMRFLSPLGPYESISSPMLPWVKGALTAGKT
jgi:hypothetical protein